MTEIREAIEILGKAESGILTFDNRFRRACKLGKQALLREEKANDKGKGSD